MIPPTWVQIPIDGTYVGTDGIPIQGSLIFRSPSPVYVDGTLVVPREITVTLDSNGSIPDGTSLPSTNDPELSITGWAYQVRENWRGGRAWSIFVPYDEPASLNIPGAAPVVPPPVLEDTRGPRGYSAYEVAVRDGFVGTVDEWLVSLKGDKGDTGDITAELQQLFDDTIAAATSAEDSATNAYASADGAAESRDAAAISADSANANATSANTSAGNAEAAATTAGTRRDQAAASATAAATSEAKAAAFASGEYTVFIDDDIAITNGGYPVTRSVRHATTLNRFYAEVLSGTSMVVTVEKNGVIVHGPVAVAFGVPVTQAVNIPVALGDRLTYNIVATAKRVWLSLDGIIA